METATKLTHTFAAAGREFTLHASATMYAAPRQGEPVGHYGAHVTEAGTDALAYNGDLILVWEGGDALAALTNLMGAVIARVAREANELAELDEQARIEAEWEAAADVAFMADRERMAEGPWGAPYDDEPAF